MPSPRPSRDPVVPAGTLTFLRRALRKEAGPLGTTHALHGAGYAAGEATLSSICEEIGATDPSELEEDRFWSELSRFFDERGWGRFEHDRVHPGMAILSSDDWMEADPDGTESQPGCAFSCGVFAHVLSRVAGGPVAVLEVTCRSRGDERCTFLFGSEGAVHQAYGHLLDGASVEQALART